MKTYIYTAVKNSPTPQHIHSVMFLKDENYKVKELTEAITKKTSELMRQWRKDAGAMSVMCEGEAIEEAAWNAMWKEAKEEEKFVKVYGKFSNSLGGFEVKEQSILKSICKEYLTFKS